MTQIDEGSLSWIERQVTRTRYSMWRTRAGFHYEDTYPHDSMDEEVAYRFDSVASGVVSGAYPELGEVWASSFEPPKTRVTLPVQHGPWVGTRDTPTNGAHPNE